MPSPPVIARHRKRGTGYTSVVPGADPSLSTVTTVAGSKYIVRSEQIVDAQDETPRDPRNEIEGELQELVAILGGGWRIEKGIMPVVVLTIPEAREVAIKLERKGYGPSEG